MHTRWDVIGVFIISFLIAHGVTPFVRTVALRLGYMDHPEYKKSHAHPTPLLGGVAIYIAFLSSMVFGVDVHKTAAGLFLGATMLLVVGLIDDKFGMMPELKLSAQILAALTAFKFGLRVTTIDDYYLCMFFTVFWIVGITNAINLLDNLNGLSSGISAISSIFFCIIAFVEKDFLAATLAASIAGASLGFLRHNFPRANIFMGDTGSLVLGFSLACLAIVGSWATEDITLSLSIPIVILAYPIFDTTLVTVIRLAEGRSIFQGGRDHSSHILAYAGFKKKRAVLTIFGVCLALGIAALVIKYSSIKIGLVTLVAAAAGMSAFGARLFWLRRTMIRMRNEKEHNDKLVSK
ncbi:MAG: undecaprenyl/decaprenyl-phosphate alpha-N-acetylglucosaminyl 1-phosphate transferase [Candidatus Omnitrophica bacterium]|nr:undecaprenyl/decaprenyl-phosphate alpha-N-acetylglucosaminyl 1-phosphate transferase [Candidatus Omnitrophota bacterium]